MRVFPAFAPTEGRLRPETDDPRTSLGKTDLNSPTAPPKDGFGQQRMAPTILQGHLSLKGPPLRASHFRGGQAQISNLRRAKRWMRFPWRVLHTHNMPFRKSESFSYPRSSWARLLYHRNIFPGNHLSTPQSPPGSLCCHWYCHRACPCGVG